MQTRGLVQKSASTSPPDQGVHIAVFDTFSGLEQLSIQSTVRKGKQMAKNGGEQATSSEQVIKEERGEHMAIASTDGA